MVAGPLITEPLDVDGVRKRRDRLPGYEDKNIHAATSLRLYVEAANWYTFTIRAAVVGQLRYSFEGQFRPFRSSPDPVGIGSEFFLH